MSRPTFGISGAEAAKHVRWMPLLGASKKPAKLLTHFHIGPGGWRQLYVPLSEALQHSLNFNDSGIKLCFVKEYGVSFFEPF